jgi:O-antigen ligase
MKRALAFALFGLVSVRICMTSVPLSLLDGAFGMAFAVALLLAIRAGPHHDTSPLAGAGLLALAPIAVACAAGVAFSWAPFVSGLWIPAFMAAPLLFVFVLWSSPDTHLGLLAAVGVGSMVNLAMALWQVWVLFPSIVDGAGKVGGASPALVHLAMAGRPMGFVPSPDLLGALGLAGAIAFFAIGFKAPRHFWLSLAGGVLCLANVLVARSHGAFVATGVAFGIFVVSQWHSPTLARGKRRPLILAGGLFVGVGLVAIAGRGLSAFSASSSMRVLNWKGALATIQNHPITGVGLGRFAAGMGAYRSPGSNETLYAHSLPLHLIAELGLVGTLLLTASLIILVLAARGRPLRQLDTPQALLFSGTVALWARCAWDYDAQIPQTAAILALMSGVFFAALHDPENVEDKVRQNATVATALVLVLLLPFLGIHLLRHQAIAPFHAWTAAPTTSDFQRLEDHAQRFSGDLQAQMILLGQLVAQRQRCATECTALDARIDAGLERLLSRRRPPASGHVAKARVLALRGDEAGVQAQLDRALQLEPGLLSAHLFRLRHAESRGLRPQKAHLDAARSWSRGQPMLADTLARVEKSP